jgi:hypothetical protein
MVSVATGALSLAITVAFDNPCRLHPVGKLSVYGDTIAVTFALRPQLPELAACPAVYAPAAFRASIDSLVPNKYVVLVSMLDRRNTAITKLSETVDVQPARNR